MDYETMVEWEHTYTTRTRGHIYKDSCVLGLVRIYAQAGGRTGGRFLTHVWNLSTM